MILHGDGLMPSVFFHNILQRLKVPAAIEEAPLYLTLPLSTTSFRALMISSRAVVWPSRWICNTSYRFPSERGFRPRHSKCVFERG
jgi:hypothetical protein